MIDSPFDNEPAVQQEPEEGVSWQNGVYNCCGCLFLIALGLGIWGIFTIINWLNGGS